MRKPSPRQLKGQEGFTLTEMLVVLGIITLIAAVLVPTVMGNLQRSRAKAARLQLDNVATAVEMFRSDVSHYPRAAEGNLNALTASGATIEGWAGPYIEARMLTDPWGRAITYELTADGDSFTLRTLGANGKVGGVGVDLDLVAPVHPAASASTAAPNGT